VPNTDFDLDVTLSLFDGMSGGQEALKRAGISTRIYLASEISKFPKFITRKNHPLTVQIGDVTKVVVDDLPHVNLLLGGSPCQGFSKAGNGLNFDHPQSKLFFEFVRLLKDCKPDYFLLENVMMKQEYQDVISNYLGVKPIKICSSLVSAQMRKRLYWTNIPNVNQPINKNIQLKDILLAKKTPLTDNVLVISEATKKGYTEIEDGDCYDATFMVSKTRRGRNMKYKSNCLTAANYEYMRYEHPKSRKLTPLECSRLQTFNDDYLEDCYDDKGKPISDSQKYRALGNGWTVDVIAHILQGIKTNGQKRYA
tara:strand:- start:52 stop:981 length:930 start_codon:yes stop_codon:yes gene_type:complete